MRAKCLQEVTPYQVYNRTVLKKAGEDLKTTIPPNGASQMLFHNHQATASLNFDKVIFFSLNYEKEIALSANYGVYNASTICISKGKPCGQTFLASTPNHYIEQKFINT
jgi:hypothetical protein